MRDAVEVAIRESSGPDEAVAAVKRVLAERSLADDPAAVLIRWCTTHECGGPVDALPHCMNWTGECVMEARRIGRVLRAAEKTEEQ